MRPFVSVFALATGLGTASALVPPLQSASPPPTSIATIYGSLFNVSQKSKLPLLYFTTGQRVPEDFEEASRERVAALIMDL